MAIVDVLRDFQFDRSASGSLQLQLYQALKERVLSGRLVAGTKLPSSRKLATSLSISRNTVNGALEQLKAEGYIKTKQGAGHFVAEDLPESFFTVSQRETSAVGGKASAPGSRVLPLSDFAHSVMSLPLKKRISNGSFEAGVPDLQAFPLKKWNQLYQHNLRPSLMGYDCAQGYAPLRNVLADYLRSSRGLICTEQQIIITVGAQQASTIALQVLLNEGELAYVENPGYIGMRKSIIASGARIQGIPVGDDGLDIQQLPENPEGKVLCLTPTHQYPTGGILPLSSRLAVLQWAAENRVWILEDDYDSEYHYDYKPIAAMQGLGLQQQVIYIGSFSKVLFPGLRLGYMVVPEGLVNACVNAKSHMAGQTAIVDQATTADFIASGLFVRHLRQMRVIYEEKLNAILEACDTYLSDVATPLYTGAGMHIVITFNQSATGQVPSDTEVLTVMESLHVYASALSTYYTDGLVKPDSVKPDSVKQGLVLGFANTEVAEMAVGVKKIRKAIDWVLGFRDPSNESLR